MALVLSLPQGEVRDLFAFVTYVVVVFSILVQGTTIKYVVEHRRRRRSAAKAAAE